MADSKIKFRLTASDETQQAFNSARHNLESMQRSAETVKRGLEAVGVAFGVKEIAEFGKSIIDLGDEMNDMSTRTGVAVKTLASYKLAAEQSGTSLESVAKGINKITLSMGQAEQGNLEVGKSLKDLGINAKDPQKAFEQLADAVAKSNDPTRLAADLQKVLGKNYAELLPLLKEGSAYLRESADASATFAEQMAKLAPNADKFNDQLAQLKLNAAGAAASLLNEIVPALNETFDRLDRVSRLRSAGATIGELLTGAYSANVAKSIANVNAQIKQTEQELSLMSKGGFDPFGDRQELEEKLARLKSIKAELRDISLSGAMKLAEEQYKHSPKAPLGNANLPSTLGASNADPLAGILKQTDTERDAEYVRFLGLLEKRFESGRIKAKEYQEALAILDKQFGRAELDPLGSGSFKTRNKDTADFIKQQQDAINELNGDIAQATAKAFDDANRHLDSLLANADFTKLKQDQEDMIFLTQAFTDGIEQADGSMRKLSESQYLDAVKSKLGLVASESQKTNDFAKELGLTFSSSFEEALAGGKKLSEILKGLADDIAKMITRKYVTEKIADKVGNFDWGSLLGSLFASANGNVFMNSPGLSAYSGTVVDRPTVFPFASGMGLMGEAGPEAILPLKRGSDGKLGVQAGGGAPVVVNMNISTPDAASFRASQGQIVAQMGRALQRGRRNM